MSPETLRDAYSRYGHLVRRRIAFVLRNGPGVDDVLQEVFIRLWRSPDGFDAADSKLRWLYRVADRCCFDVLAQRKRRGEVDIADVVDHPTASVNPTKSIDNRDLVCALLGNFDPRDQAIALLYFHDEMTLDEVAHEVDLTRQTVAKRIEYILSRSQVHARRLGASLR
jgi:RNA polymerase sigma-70 factor (ECF subfamily)